MVRFTFFLEMRRSAVCHFIKVERKSNKTSWERPNLKNKDSTPTLKVPKTNAPKGTPKTPWLVLCWEAPGAFFAPARHQRMPSALTALKTSWIFGVSLLNTQELWCFWIAWATVCLFAIRFGTALNRFGTQSNDKPDSVDTHTPWLFRIILTKHK